MIPSRLLLTFFVLPVLFSAAPARAVTGTWKLLPNSPVPTATTGRHDDLSFINEREGWVVNGDGDIYSTADGGDTWTHLVNTGVYNRCVVFTDSLHGVVGYLYRKMGTPLSVTTDGGLNWSLINLPDPVPRGICGLWAASSQVIYGVGAYYGTPTLIKTTDGGSTWTTRSMSAWCGALVDCYFWHPDSGIAVGSTAPDSSRTPLILMTTDGGQNWSLRWSGTRHMELCWKISFVSRQVGFVSIENLAEIGATYFLKTTDGGLTWQEHLFEPTYHDCEGIGFIDEQTGWIGGWDMSTEVTYDGGATWLQAGFGRNMNRFRFLSPTAGYACGDRVYKWTNEVSGVAELPREPAGHPELLHQNSPNPFTRETRIAYTIERTGPVTLKVYDVQGRQIMSLFQGIKPPGNYQAILDGHDLAAGLYSYRLITASGAETRKMWVVR